jgi:hypothetical protein
MKQITPLLKDKIMRRSEMSTKKEKARARPKKDKPFYVWIVEMNDAQLSPIKNVAMDYHLRRIGIVVLDVREGDLLDIQRASDHIQRGG